jgi:hypothetical protein
MLYDMSNAYLICTVRDETGNIVNASDLPLGAMQAVVHPAGFWESLVALGGVRRWGDEGDEDETTVKILPVRRGRKFNGNRSRVRRFFSKLKE